MKKEYLLIEIEKMIKKIINNPEIFKDGMSEEIIELLVQIEKELK